MAYHPPTRTAAPPDHPVLVYDGGCPFCSAAARFVQRHAREHVEVVPFDEATGRGWLVALDAREVRASAHLVQPDGREYHGGESITRALRLLPGGGAAAALDLPLARHLREAGYEAIARARPLLSRVIH